jgi:enamine deaminase RidA (YjgF/YER057c/UK114 family)
MSSGLTFVNPSTLERPLGYAHAVAIPAGRLLLIAGQIANDREGKMVGPGDLVSQFRQICQNLKDIVEAAGGQLTDIARMRMFVADVEDYKRKREPIGVVYREFFGKHFPAMTVVEVKSLYVSDVGGLIEIEAEANLG